jgi:hypothetical protein
VSNGSLLPRCSRYALIYRLMLSDRRKKMKLRERPSFDIVAALRVKMRDALSYVESQGPKSILWVRDSLRQRVFDWRSVRPRASAGSAAALDFKPKLDKIVELLLYLAHRRPGSDKRQAAKFLYLADREHLVRYGRPITFESYYALSDGPTASNALDLLNGSPLALKAAKVDQLPFRTEIGVARDGKDTTFIREPFREVDDDLFSTSDLRVFDEILQKYGDASFDELMKVTRAHYAYARAWDTRRRDQRAEMFYEEMIDDVRLRAALVEDLSPIAANMR